jgi:GTP cyclohydrolase I (EC 3.5.4.16)
MFPEDIQNRPDHRHIEIQKVGVKNIKYPIIVKDKKITPSIPLLRLICT